MGGSGLGCSETPWILAEPLISSLNLDSSTRTINSTAADFGHHQRLLVKVDWRDHSSYPGVRENIQIEPEQIKSIQQHDVIMLRDEVLPLYDLAGCLGFTPVDRSGPLPVIIVWVKGEKAGFIVEDLIGQQEIVIKSLSSVVGDVRGIAGATILGNGQVALIIDNSTLIG